MAVLIDEKTKVLVQGMTGRQGSFHTARMVEYGTRVVAGVSPGRGGQDVDGIPVYETVEAAMGRHGANASILFVPAPFAKDAACEALHAGLDLVVLITEHIPVHDAMEIMAFAAERGGTVIGPNTFGIIAPGRSKVGIMPSQIYQAGPVGVVSRSGTLSYEIADQLSRADLGQSTVIGMGGDRAVGLDFIEILRMFERDDETEAVVLIGEIGGTAEEDAAEFIKGMAKPVVAYLAGRNAPPGKRMGHAGAIVQRGRGSFESKEQALREGGALVAEFPWDVPQLVKQALRA